MIYLKNFKALQKIGFNKDTQYVKIKNEPFMPLWVERIDENRYSIAHSYIQNGDVMRDPEIVFELIFLNGAPEAVEVLSFRQDNIGLYQEVYVCDDEGKKIKVRPKLKKDLNTFFAMWLKNLKAQGFDLNKNPIGDAKGIE